MVGSVGYPFGVPAPTNRPNLGGCGCSSLGEEPGKDKKNLVPVFALGVVLVLGGAIVYYDVMNARTK